MRRFVTAVLVLIAAAAGPLRQACGTTCVDDAAPIEHATTERSGCHKPEARPEPQPAHDDCAHDHAASVTASPRFEMAATIAQPAYVSGTFDLLTPDAVAPAPAPRPEVSPGSPPIRRIALRI